jgi:class 3 adenylate cyclase/ActR/RegA family two-component response regulator
MPIPSLKPIAAQIGKTISSQTITIALWVVPVLVAVGFAGYVSIAQLRRENEAIAQHRQGAIAARIDEKLRADLTVLEQLDRTNVRAIAQKSSDLTQLPAWKSRLQEQLQQTDVLGAIAIVTANKQDIRAVKPGIAGLPNPGTLATQPWYLAAIQTGRSIWSQPLLSSQSPSGRSIATPPLYVTPLYNAQKQPVGAIASFADWRSFEAFLQGLDRSQLGVTALVDAAGHPIAASTPDRARQAEVPAALQAAITQFGSLDRIDTPQTIRSDIGGKPKFSYVLPLQGDRDLNWFAVTIVPESELIRPHPTLTALLLSSGAIVVAASLVGFGIGQRARVLLSSRNQKLKAALRTLAIENEELKRQSIEPYVDEIVTPIPQKVDLAQAGEQIKILLVDDDLKHSELLIQYLSQAHYTVVRVGNGIEALSLIDRHFQPNLILLSESLPDMTGYEICQKIRMQFGAHELPVVMLTPTDLVAEGVEELEAGFNDYLVKPVSKPRLMIRIKTHLRFAHLNAAYSRFVPRQFLQLLQKDSILDVKLGDNILREMSILFSDIRSFTAMSEKMSPEENFRFINSYLSRMEPAIAENRGFIDKYIGDAIMALFGGSADDAIKAAIAMLETLVEYNQHRESVGYPGVKIGIGINTGSLMLGTVGGKNRMDGTVISDAVNLASRVESLTKQYGVSLLISHETFARIQNPSDYKIRLIERLKVKGKSKAVAVFEVFDGDPPQLRDAKLATTGIFEEGVLFYYGSSFRKAAQCFEKCLAQNPDDTVAQIYLERCQERLLT